MTKTQRIDALKNIKKRFVSFLSICVIIMFGIGGSFSTQFLGKGLNTTIAEYYAELNFMDYEVVSSMGITQNDLEEINKIEEIAQVEGSIALDGTLNKGDKIENVRVMSLTTNINKVQLLEGRLPEKINECVLTEDIFESLGVKIGDKVKLNVLFNDQNPLKENEYTIVGYVHHPYYVRNYQTYCAVVLEDAFDKDITQGLYTSAYVRNNSAITLDTVKTISTEDAVKDKIWNLIYDLQKDDVEYFKELANKKIDEEWAKAQEQLHDAENQIAEKEKELEAGLKTAKAALADAKAQLNSAKSQLESAEAQISSGEAQLNEAKALIAKADPIFGAIAPEEVISILNEALTLTNNLQAAIESEDQDRINQVRQDIADWLAREDVDEALTKADEITGLQVKEFMHKASQGTLLPETATYIRLGITLTQQYVTYKPQIPALEAQLAEGKQKVADGWNQYNSGLAQYNSKVAEMKAKETEARAQIADAKAKVEQAWEDATKKVELAREEADKLDVNLIVTSHSGNVAFVELNTNVNAIKSAGIVFGFLFLLITCLVCFSTLAIMVEEDKKQVGTTKAFGFYNKEVLLKYLYYGVGAAIVGSILGVGLAYVLALFVNGQLAKVGNYAFGLAKTLIPVPQTIGVCIFAIVVCALTTVVSCYTLMKTPASLLMKGETIASRNNKLKKKKASTNGTLYSRLIVKNMLDEKARVFITILIVAVSVAIIGVGITLKLGFDGMFEQQINNVYNYDLRVSFPSDMDEETLNKVEEVFNEKNVSYLEATYEVHLYNDDNNVDALYVIAADGDKIGDYFYIRDPETKEIITLPDNGLIVQNKFVKAKGMTTGKQFRFLDNSLHYHEVEVAGAFINFQGRLSFLSTEAYRSIFTVRPTPNCYFVKLNGANAEELKSALTAVSKDISYTANNDFFKKYAPVKSLYNIIVYVLTIMAVVMSFMILTNLANIFVTRKKKELIVMRINGFSIKQTINYLARETIITIIIGLIIGLGIGIALGFVAMDLMEPSEVSFDHSVKPIAWVIAVVVEAIFASIINFLAFRKVKHLSFRDITS